MSAIYDFGQPFYIPNIFWSEWLTKLQIGEIFVSHF
jgi:hypothetical protein